MLCLKVSLPKPPEIDAPSVSSRLDKWLAENLNPELGASRSRIQKWIEQGKIKVDGKIQRSKRFGLNGGEAIEVDITDLKNTIETRQVEHTKKTEAHPLKLDVLWEDDDLLVINKDAGSVVHPTPENETGITVMQSARHYCKDTLSSVAGIFRRGIVHRLDKDTSGVMILAKTDFSHLRLVESFSKREVEKFYLAWVIGTPKRHLDIQSGYARHPVHRIKFTGKTQATKQAITFAKVDNEGMASAFGVSRLKVAIKTGRTHQIRVHLSEAGFPLLRDALYGSSKQEARLPPPAKKALAFLNRQALHAHSLKIIHPRSQEPLHFTAPIKADLRGFEEAIYAELLNTPRGGFWGYPEY